MERKEELQQEGKTDERDQKQKYNNYKTEQMETRIKRGEKGMKDENREQRIGRGEQKAETGQKRKDN